MRAFLVMHPRTSALYILGIAAVVVGVDALRLAHALHSVLTGEWWLHAMIGAALGATASAFGIGITIAARRAGEQWVHRAWVAMAVLAALMLELTHPWNQGGIRDWGMFQAVVALDTCVVLVLGYAAVMRWRAPVPDFDAVAHARPRHGRRWRRRSAARHPGRPGGR